MAFSPPTTIPQSRHRRLLAAMVLILSAPAWTAAQQWPQCDIRSGDRGGPAIVVNGQTLAPLFFSANNQFNRDGVLIEELRLAAKADIPFFTVNLPLGWLKTDEEAAEILERFCAAHPEGYFLLRTWIGPNGRWVNEHPDECITKANGERLRMASPSSVPWREETERLLRERLHQVITGPHGHRFLGIALHYLQTAEWFYPQTNEFMDYSPANLAAFRAWLKQTYRREKTLRKAWNSTEVTFNNAEFPTPEEREAAAWGPFRDPAKHQAAMDMQRFQSELIAETIAHFAGVVKDVTDGRSLMATFYGYCLELNNNGPRALAHSGHLAFARILECPDVDLILAPYSYFQRELGQPGHFHLPVDSVALHGKLAIMEEDSYTHLAQEPPKGITAPGWNNRTKSLPETLSLSRRNYGNFLTHRCGLWFFDLLSDGRWNDKTFWNSTALLRRMAAELRSEGPFRPEVAFLVNEKAVPLLRSTTHPYLLHSLSYWRAELARIGTPVGYYLQSDLPRLPDSVKVLILANPYVLTRPEARLLDDLLERGGTVIYTYAVDVMGDGAPDAARVSKATGFEVEARFDDIPMSFRDDPAGHAYKMGGALWKPRFVVTSEDVDVLTRYTETEEVSCAARPSGNGVVVYTAAPRLSAATLRTIAERAGVHRYWDTPGMTGVVGPYLIVHTPQAKEPAEHTFHWPDADRPMRRIVPASPMGLFPLDETRRTDLLVPQTTAVYQFRN